MWEEVPIASFLYLSVPLEDTVGEPLCWFKHYLEPDGKCHGISQVSSDMEITYKGRLHESHGYVLRFEIGEGTVKLHYDHTTSARYMMQVRQTPISSTMEAMQVLSVMMDDLDRALVHDK
ncbi:hypothetical protein MUK42_37038 [Musa troglodytarum]|uniref:Uncharacterized protein n=1 Tax=Musa troglodytarum TaxID=320322 RepID=A0A9E7FGH2_9LILI|nr:hypothetical protein MUK42_37038 [Musa troglodytarum]